MSDPTDPSLSSRQPAKPSLTRRQLLQRAAAASSAIAFPAIVPESALGRGGFVAPSERIVLGGLGVGNRGAHVLGGMLEEKDVQFVAICDIKKASRDRVKGLVDTKYGNSDCRVYTDLREFLASRTDIDALLIATGDRWHAVAATLAMRAGKDVYCEKPSSMTIAEGRLVMETARRYGRIYQTGTQRLSEANFVFATELARSGKLGKIHTAYAHIAPWDGAVMRTDWLPEQPLPPKEELDWDAWLGPCPWRPYNKDYVNGAWRNHYDFHTSCIGEWGAHTFAQAMAGIDQLFTAASEYHYVNNDSGEGMVTVFPNGVKMILSKTHWRGSCGMRFDGPEGWVAVADGYARPEVSKPALLGEFTKLVGDYVARTGHPMSHARDFFDCVKSRRQPVANPEVMHRSMTTVHAANICMWLKRDMKYDPVKEEFTGDSQANRLRIRAQREPWVF